MKTTTKKQKERLTRLMPKGEPRYVRCYDNGGETFDRYTVVFTGNYKGRTECVYVGMSENPFSPQGFGQHGSSEHVIDWPSYSHLGKAIKFADLPKDCQELVISDYKEFWNL